MQALSHQDVPAARQPLCAAMATHDRRLPARCRDAHSPAQLLPAVGLQALMGAHMTAAHSWRTLLVALAMALVSVLRGASGTQANGSAGQGRPAWMDSAGACIPWGGGAGGPGWEPPR